MINAALKQLDIYAAKIDKAVKAKGRRVLFKLGGYVRTTMQNSMPYQSASSKPGQPPAAHKATGAGLRKLIYFGVDLDAETVVIGPAIKGDSKVLSNKPLPQLLNEGGKVDIKGRSVSIAPRPFIEPAHEVGLDRFLKLIEQEQLRD